VGYLKNPFSIHNQPDVKCVANETSIFTWHTDFDPHFCPKKGPKKHFFDDFFGRTSKFNICKSLYPSLFQLPWKGTPKNGVKKGVKKQKNDPFGL